MPAKPEGDICIVDIPRFQLICAKIKSAQNPTDLFDVQKFFLENELTVIPLADADRFVAFSPDTWGNIEIYIKKLEAEIINEGK